MNAVRIQRESNHNQPSQPTTVNTMNVKTNVKAGPSYTFYRRYTEFR